MTLIGWAADGFPIYAPYAYTDPNNTNSAIKEMKPGYRVKQGTRPGGPGGRTVGHVPAGAVPGALPFGSRRPGRDGWAGANRGGAVIDAV